MLEIHTKLFLGPSKVFSGILDRCNGKYSEFKKAVDFYLKQAWNKLHCIKSPCFSFCFLIIYLGLRLHRKQSQYMLLKMERWRFIEWNSEWYNKHRGSILYRWYWVYHFLRKYTDIWLDSHLWLTPVNNLQEGERMLTLSARVTYDFVFHQLCHSRAAVKDIIFFS